jgi:hypothetical protein
MSTVTKEELAQLAKEAGEKIRDVLLPFMRAGVSVSIHHNVDEGLYETKLRADEYVYTILHTVPIFGERSDG